MTLLSIRGLTVEGRQGDAWVPLVRGIDLDLQRGEVLGLIGESGAGKSTLGLAAMGYVRPGCRIASGQILFDGTDLAAATEAERRAVLGARAAYVAQSAAASFNPAHRLMDQHVEGPLLHGTATRREAEADAVDLYRRMRLPEPDRIGLRYPHQVSGGQLQRAMTAMAMATRPALIVFDEPTTALDVTTQIEVLATIRRIVEEFGASALYITHDLAVVAQMADRIKVLLRGDEVEEQGTREMLAAPREPYTKSLWAVRTHRRAPAPPPTAEPALAVEGVTAGYGALDVLHDVSFDLHRGRTTAVVGESGSGKSTAARVVAGLLPARRGAIRLDGRPLAPSYRSRAKADLRAVQLVYQSADTALNPRQTVRETLARPAAFHGGLSGEALDRRVRDLMAMIEMDAAAFLDRLPSELSGGQKQRVGIARALAADPDVLICDEVTSALDQIVAEGILRLLDRLQRDLDLAVMFITHDLATVRAVADEVVVMKGGRIVDRGDRERVFQPPHHPYTERLLRSVPEMDPDWLTRALAEPRA